MIVTTGPQLNGTWLEWKAFYYPDPSGAKWAYSVPTVVANQLNSAYAIMINIMAAQFWAIIISLIAAIMLRNKKPEAKRFSSLMPSLWNKRSNLIESVSDTIASLMTRDGVESSPQLWAALLLVFGLFVGQTVMSIIVASRIIIYNAAPVNPDAIYVPSNANTDPSSLVAAYILNAPWALRALGTATSAISTLRRFVDVSQEATVGTWNGTAGPGDIEQITYGYRVTGADMGLQSYPDLTLTVNGSCFTDYTWYQGGQLLGGVIGEDVYSFFGEPNNTFVVSPLDGHTPVATFQPGAVALPGALANSNATWGAIISSVNKTSFSPGTDPWYLTVVNPSGSSSGAGYRVKPGRPGLSCWEDDVWSFRGRSSSISDIGSLPGLGLSAGMQAVLQQYLGEPMVLSMSQNLGGSALISGSTSLGTIINAGGSSIHGDLERLVVAAYVATTNVLTATTLYPAGAASTLPNSVQSESGGILDGVGDFVVYTPDAAALDMVLVITIPALLVGIMLLSFLLLLLTPLGKAKALDAHPLFLKLIGAHARPNKGDGRADISFRIAAGPRWTFTDEPDEPDEGDKKKKKMNTSDGPGSVNTSINNGIEVTVTGPSNDKITAGSSEHRVTTPGSEHPLAPAQGP